MGSSRFRFGLASRMLLVVLLAVVPLAGRIVYSAWTDFEREEARERTTSQRQAENTAVRLHDYISGTHQLLISLARAHEVHKGNAGACAALMASVLQGLPDYLNMGVADASGNLWCSARPLKQAINTSDRLYFQRAKETRDFAVGSYVAGRVTGKSSITFAYPLFDERNQFGGVVFAALDAGVIQRQALRTQLAEGMLLLIVDGGGNVLARSEQPEEWVGRRYSDSSMLEQARRGVRGTMETVALDGIRRVFAYAPLEWQGDTGSGS